MFYLLMVSSSLGRLDHERLSFFPQSHAQGGGSPGEQGAGGVRETGKERAGGGISTMAGSGKEIQKGSQRNEPNNVS